MLFLDLVELTDIRVYSLIVYDMSETLYMLGIQLTLLLFEIQLIPSKTMPKYLSCSSIELE